MTAMMANATSPLAALDLSPSGELHLPLYFAHRASLLPALSDKHLSLLLPILIYWLLSALYYTLDVLELPYFEQFRLHESGEVTKRNRVSVGQVVRMVLVQQLIQTALGILVLDGDEVSHAQVFADHRQQMRVLGQTLARSLALVLGEQRTLEILTRAGTPAIEFLYWWGIPALQFLWAFFVMDTWQYFIHRAFHESRWLYRNFHSHHHRLYVPYAFGALYNHPLEGLLFDSLGGALSHKAALMTTRQGIALFTFATFKTVSDHGGYSLPWYLDPLHLFFPNTAAYHDVHHQMLGLKFNYSQPFFVHFDVLLGTRMSVDKFRALVEAKKGRREKVVPGGGGDGQSEERSTTATATAANGTAVANGSDLRARRPASKTADADADTNGHPISSTNGGNDDAAANLPPSQIIKDRIAHASSNGNGNGIGNGNGNAALPPDPLVTLTEEDYRAKAGTATG